MTTTKRILLLPIDGNDDFILEVHVKDTCETSDADILRLMDDANCAWCGYDLDRLTDQGLDIGDWDEDNINCVCCSEFIIDILDLNLEHGDIESWDCYDNYTLGEHVDDLDDLDFGDLFFFNDANGTLDEAYINWDCNSGQAIIETSYDYDLILKAYDEEPDLTCFWDRLDNDRALDVYNDCNYSGDGYVYDDDGDPVITDEYKALKLAYVKSNPDFQFAKVTPLSDFSISYINLIVAHARHWKECRHR